MRIPSIAMAGIALAVLLTLMCVPASAGDTVLSGSVLMDNRLTIEPGEESRFSYNEVSFNAIVEAFPAEGVSLRAGLQIEAISMDEKLEGDVLIDIGQQQSRTEVDPIRIELDEAYILITGLGLVKNLDLKIGKQRIAWGTGDQFNPTDTLNPDDFHDPLEFGRKIPSPAIQAIYYAGPVTLTGVFLPLFQTTLLPVTDVRANFELQFEKMADEFDIDTGSEMLNTLFDLFFTPALETASLGEIEVVNQLPEPTASNVGAAFKLASAAGPVDFSFSYAYVYEDFAVPKTIELSTVPFSGENLIDKIDMRITQGYPRLHVIGGDFSMSVPVLDIGFWGEATYTIPEPFKTTYKLDAGSVFNGVLGAIGDLDVEDDLVIAEDEPLDKHYIKAVTGIDYTFPGATMINIQYVRGLPSDNTYDTIEDYVVGGLNQPLLNDSITIRAFGGYCVGDDSFFIYPQIFWSPKDSLVVHAGVFLVGGELDTKYGAFGDDIVFLQTKLSF